MNKFTVFVAEKLHELGQEILSNEATMIYETGLSPEQLVTRLQESEADALIVRSGTKVTEALMNAVPSLKVVGRAGTGVDNIDLKAATARGIIVVNAPTGNSLAAAEHAIALMAALARNIPQADAAMRRGEWDRHRFIGTALTGKTLGIVAMGRVGTEVARRAKGLGMTVVAHDPYYPAERAAALGVPLIDLDALWAQSDFITLHAPLTDGTRHLINTENLAKMKAGVFIINDARGGLIDDQALAEALESGHVAGAALDVFAVEPPQADDPLLGRDNVITTPHLGASTTEAQLDVAREVTESVLGALRGETVGSTVNAPLVAPELMEALRPFMGLAESLARVAVQLAPRGSDHLTVTYRGLPAKHDNRPLRAAIIKGLIEPISTARINLVNAELVAKARGLKITEIKEAAEEGRRDAITIRVGDDQATEVQGALLRGQPHIVRIGDYWIDLELRGHMLLCRNSDRPGMIGQVGTLLGTEQVNISFMQVGRDAPRGTAVMAIGLDELPPERLVHEIAALPDISEAHVISLNGAA